MSDTTHKLTVKDLKSDQEARWCPGCGDHAVMNAIQRALIELDIPKENFDQLRLCQNSQFVVENNNPDNITAIKVVDQKNNVTFEAVPYYFWDNRDPGRMKVWIEMEDPDKSTFLYYTDSKSL